MATLTANRLAAAKDILEAYRKRLHETGNMDVGTFEAELRKAWGGMKYNATWKSIVIDMAKNHPRYKYVVAYYIEHEHFAGVSAHYRSELNNLYGTRHVAGEEREKKKAAFWKKIGPKQGGKSDGAQDHGEARQRRRANSATSRRTPKANRQD